jgi:regulator of protease activity HflC (stomatin/prohibitin superfamily)
LLPPGMHSWTSETMMFKHLKLLDDHVITLGPYTIVTVDEGYSAITQNNGLQVVLDGGETHLLTHQKWRFEKFMTQKIQTDDLAEISAASADNVIMSVDSTVVWRIKDVRLAAVSAAETMARAGGEVSADIVKLRKDVLKQATASLASFIGSVNYSDSFHMAAAAQRNVETVYAVPIDQNPADVHETSNPMFDTEGMSEAVSHANQIVSKFGIEILSINIISANPVDANLTRALATGAVASAEALQAETQARGNAKAQRIVADTSAITRKIDADSEAESILIRARAEADAEMIRAEGHKHAELLRAEASRDAAVMLETSEVAVALETMRASACAIKNTDKFFFGQEPSYLANLIMKAPETAADVIAG